MSPGQPANDQSLALAFIDCCIQQFLGLFETRSGLALSRAVSTEPGPEIPDASDLIGMEQALEQAPGAAFWIGVAASQAAQIGELLVEPDRAGGSDSENALVDVLTSSLELAVRQVAATFLLGNAQGVIAHQFEQDDVQCLVPVRFSGPEGIEFALFLGISSQLKTLMVGRIAGRPATLPSSIPAASAAGGTLDMLLDFELPVSISFGRKKLAFKDVLKLSLSSVVDLNRAPDDLVEVIVNDSVIAWGEVVVIDGQYGVRIRRLASGGAAASLGTTVQG